MCQQRLGRKLEQKNDSLSFKLEYPNHRSCLFWALLSGAEPQVKIPPLQSELGSLCPDIQHGEVTACDLQLGAWAEHTRPPAGRTISEGHPGLLAPPEEDGARRW